MCYIYASCEGLSSVEKVIMEDVYKEDDYGTNTSHLVYCPFGLW